MVAIDNFKDAYRQFQSKNTLSQELKNKIELEITQQIAEAEKLVVNKAGKFTLQQIDEYVVLATKNKNARKVILGKYDNLEATSYIKRAGEDYTYFDMGMEKWKEAETLVNKNLDEMWKINKKFIDNQKSLNKEFELGI